MVIQFEHTAEDTRNINRMFIMFLNDRWKGVEWFQSRRDALALEFAQENNLHYQGIETDDADNETICFSALELV